MAVLILCQVLTSSCRPDRFADHRHGQATESAGRNSPAKCARFRRHSRVLQSRLRLACGQVEVGPSVDAVGAGVDPTVSRAVLLRTVRDILPIP